jgi:hypothetical protein
MKAMLERIKKFLLMPGGFILTLTFVTSVIYFRKLLPELSVRYWPANTGQAFWNTLRDMCGLVDIKQVILTLPLDVAALTVSQQNILRIAFQNPTIYISYLWVFVLAATGAATIASQFIYNLIVRPIWLRQTKDVAWEDVEMPTWQPDQDKFSLVVGVQHNPRDLSIVKKPRIIKIPLNSLRTGVIVTGTTGTGKTYGALYSYTRQSLYFRPQDQERKPGMLILDVKGNYCDKVLDFIDEVGRRDDVIIIELAGQYKYNPLHKPHIRAQVLANRLRVILETFSTGTGDSYWLDKAESMITEAIKLARLAEYGYVSFTIIDNIIRKKQYKQMIETLSQKKEKGMLSADEIAMFSTVTDYFNLEYEGYDQKIRSIIESEVTRMTAAFITDPSIMETFCPPREELNFFGFDELVDKGKIVILRMNSEEFQNLAKIMSTYLKLDFQSSVMTRLTRPGANRKRPLVFINDEYHFMASRTDGKFFSVCREADCVNIVATQSFTSLIQSIGDKTSVQAILQNLVNKIWLRSDDDFTIEAAQKATGKTEKSRRSESISESGKNSSYSWAYGRSTASDSNLTKSVNYQTVEDYIFPYDFFRQQLRILTGVAFYYLGNPIGSIDQDIHCSVLHLIPYDHLPLKPIKPLQAANDSAKDNMAASAQEDAIIKSSVAGPPERTIQKELKEPEREFEQKEADFDISQDGSKGFTEPVEITPVVFSPEMESGLDPESEQAVKPKLEDGTPKKHEEIEREFDDFWDK